MAIVLPGGFDIKNNEPADARISLADQTARLGLSAANVYEGLVVYQRDTDKLYVLVNASDPSVSGNWSEVGAGTGTGNITGSGATNQVTYFTGATSVTGSNGFTFDGSDVVVTGDISASTYTGSLVSAGDINFPYGLDVTGSLNVVNGQISASFYTGSFSGDGSQVTGVVSASYAVTASHALNGGGGGGVTINNNTDNYLVTATGTADTLDGEQNLTFNGNDLGITGSLLMQATTTGANDMITLTSGSQQGIIRIGNGSFEFKGTSAGLRFEANNGTEIFYNGLQFTSNNEHQLGSDGSRWGRLYVTDVSSSGEISASSFIGDGSQVTGVVSSSYALTASYAANGGGGGVTINNNTDNYLVTATGTADTLDGESKLTFDGTTFNVDGAFTANTKSFLIDHQSLPGKKLIYGVLEGPEHAVYLRGRLTNDDTITFPEEWSWLVDKDTITVQLTPIGSHHHLWVEQVTETSITVNSNTDIDCYYLVHATRKDVDPLQTVK